MNILFQCVNKKRIFNVLVDEYVTKIDTQIMKYQSYIDWHTRQAEMALYNYRSAVREFGKDFWWADMYWDKYITAKNRIKKHVKFQEHWIERKNLLNNLLETL